MTTAQFPPTVHIERLRPQLTSVRLDRAAMLVSLESSLTVATPAGPIMIGPVVAAAIPQRLYFQVEATKATVLVLHLGDTNLGFQSILPKRTCLTAAMFDRLISLAPRIASQKAIQSAERMLVGWTFSGLDSLRMRPGQASLGRTRALNADMLTMEQALLLSLEASGPTIDTLGRKAYSTFLRAVGITPRQYKIETTRRLAVLGQSRSTSTQAA